MSNSCDTAEQTIHYIGTRTLRIPVADGSDHITLEVEFYDNFPLHPRYACYSREMGLSAGAPTEREAVESFLLTATFLLTGRTDPYLEIRPREQ